MPNYFEDGPVNRYLAITGESREQLETKIALGDTNATMLFVVECLAGEIRGIELGVKKAIDSAADAITSALAN